MILRPRPDPGPSPTALFRYFVLGQIEAFLLQGGTVGEALRTVADRQHLHPNGRLVQVSKRSLQRWRKALAEGGPSALANKPRDPKPSSLPADFVAFLESEKGRDPRASVPELIRRARAHEIIPVDLPLDRTTVWRTCKRLDLPTRVRPSKRELDARRFQHPHRMRCVLCDGKHFRAGPDALKRVALFFLDDATRRLLDVIVCTAEAAEPFLEGLHRVVRRYGAMDLLYMDKGPGFIADDTKAVVLALNAWLAHGRTAYPEGHGKVERFNQTAFDQALRALSAPGVDPDCGALALRLRHFMETYNDTPHESLGQQTPRARWDADPHPLKFPADDAELDRHFVVREPRTVSNDHVIKHGGALWEAPRGLARQRVLVHRNTLSGDLFVLHQGKMVRLHTVDLIANAAERRGEPTDSGAPASGAPITAASIRFQRDFAPLVDEAGNYKEK